MQVQIISPSDIIGAGIANALPDIHTSHHRVPPNRRADLYLIQDVNSVPVTDVQSPWLAFGSHLQPARIDGLIRSGSRGYLYLGDPLVDRLRFIIGDVTAGGIHLSPSASAAYHQFRFTCTETLPRLNPYHQNVLRLMHSGHSPDDIAVQLTRSRNAIYQVQRHLRRLFEVESNTDLLSLSRAYSSHSDW